MANPRRKSCRFGGLKNNLVTMFGLLVAGGVITWILITDGVRDISFGLSMNFLPVYMQQYGFMNFRQIGLMNSIFGLFVMLSTIPGGWLADKIGERFVIVLGFISIGGSLVDVDRTAGLQPVALRIRLGAGRDRRRPDDAGLSVPDQQGRPEEGARHGLWTLQQQPGAGLAARPWIGGQLWEKVGPRSPFLITIVGLIPVGHPGLVQIQTAEE